MGYTPHVLVLGGGVTGTAIARDLSIRGLDVTLVERDTLGSGATGRMQGLLYSGARYADVDPKVARQCIEENRTLTEIASHCIEETDGLLVADSDDDSLDALLSACEDCEIPTETLSGEQARSLEPGLSEDVERAVRVPDRTVDPFRLTVATAKSALDHGAEIRTQTEVADILVADGAVDAVTVEYDPGPTGRETGAAKDGEDAEDGDDSADDDRGVEEADDGGDGDAKDETGDKDDDAAGDAVPDGGKKYPGSDTDTIQPGGISEAGATTGMPGATGADRQERPTSTVETIEPDYVVNATGAWADQVAGLAGLELPMRRSRSAMAVTQDRPVEMPVTDGLTAGGADTAVPHGEHCVIGTSDEPTDDPDDLDGEAGEVDRLLGDLSGTVPSLGDARLLRSFWGVRSGPPGAGSEGRPFALVDHADQDCWGMTTVVGGTLTTHRLVAERVSDQVCRKFGIPRECRTAEMGLPGSGVDESVLEDAMDQFGLSSPVYERSKARLGGRTASVLLTDGPNPIICEAQSVTRAEIRDALDDETTTDVDLNDVRIRTSAAMGRCQGGRCAHRIAAELHPDYDDATVEDALDDLLAERWKGQRHVLWGDQLAQAARSYQFHASTLSRKYLPDEELDIDGFDDGPPEDSGDTAAAIRRGVRR